MTLKRVTPLGRDLTLLLGVPWALLALGGVWAELTWNLSAAELTRLSVPGGLAVRLGIVLLLVLGADRLAAARAG